MNRYEINGVKVGTAFNKTTDLWEWQKENNDTLEELADYDIDQELADNLDIDQLLETYTTGKEGLVKAAIYCDVSYGDIDEAYQGKFDSDEDFAQSLAESIGCLDYDLTWPHNCIDWDKAARELMYDYSSHDGYYFRNL